MRSPTLVSLAALCSVASGALAPAYGPQEQAVFQPREPADQTSGSFSWTSIQPSISLEFHDCWGEYQCARLDVPMDRNGSLPDRVAIALIKLPARVPVTDPRYGGPILINPGGPGGSGVVLFHGEAKWMQVVADAAHLNDSAEYVVDSPGARYYDIIGFDPRGVNNTTPFYSCHSSTNAALDWRLAGAGKLLGTPETNPDVLWAHYAAEGLGCVHDAEHNPAGSKIANFMTTANVVGDLVDIVERHGEWREKQAAAHGLAGSALASLKWQRGEEPLNFWGFSYGTILGSTFAAMQPHRVHRLVLEGVVDAVDYYSGDFYVAPVDADASLDRFFEYCALAGPERCPLWNGPRAADTKARFDAIDQDMLTRGPIAVPASSTHGPDIITLTDLRSLVSSASYKLASQAPLLARLTAPLTHRNGSLFAAWKQNGTKPLALAHAPALIDPHDPSSIAHEQLRDHAIFFQAIFCSDSAWNRTRRAFNQQWATLHNMSRLMGDDVATMMVRCAAWRAHPPWRFVDAHPVASNATAQPILFASSSLDLITPLRAARTMQARFRGAGLAVVDGEGHCASSTASLCHGRRLRDYFQTARVPPDEAWCLPHARPFLGTEAPRVEPVPRNLGVEARTLLSALENLAGLTDKPRDRAAGLLEFA